MNRQQRLGQLMHRRGLDAVVLRRPANFAWYTGGADSKVDHVAPEGVADLIVSAGSQLVLTSTIEAPRRRAMLVASSERGGLYANLTRIVELEEPDPQLARRMRACEEILARMREEATRPGRTLAEAFADCRRFYADTGFPEEWRLHHQGGLTGYGSRELIVTPSSDHVIESGQAFAWNPSVTGAKAEETFVLTATGAESVTGPSLAAV
jgi:Xaa-Pro aminopeptidase